MPARFETPLNDVGCLTNAGHIRLWGKIKKSRNGPGSGLHTKQSRKLRGIAEYCLIPEPIYDRAGRQREELVKEFAHLTLPQVYDALSYYYENKTEIDRELSLTEQELKVKVQAR